MTTATTEESPAGVSGIWPLLYSIVSRLVVVLAIVPWIAWVVGGFGHLVIDPPMPYVSISLTIDGEGMMLQKGPAWRRTKPIHFQKPIGIAWRNRLSDIESTWITQWIVFSSWSSGVATYGLIGIRFGLLLPVSLIVLSLRFWMVGTRRHQQLTAADR